MNIKIGSKEYYARKKVTERRTLKWVEDGMFESAIKFGFYTKSDIRKSETITEAENGPERSGYYTVWGELRGKTCMQYYMDDDVWVTDEGRFYYSDEMHNNGYIMWYGL